VILVPTRDLAEQVHAVTKQLLYYCAKDIQCVNIAGDQSTQSIKLLLADSPDIVISTPSRLLSCLEAGQVELRSHLKSFVIDEADLVLSFGYEDDIKSIMTHMPRAYQSFLMSATLTEVRVSPSAWVYDVYHCATYVYIRM
jgi:ATP-dependent RNA helicase DDX56/DBP9